MSITMNLPDLDRLVSDADRKQKLEEVTMRAAFLMRQYVPRDENTLRASEPLNSRYERGEITWNTPYANTQYSVPMAHTTPGTTDHWDEAFMRNDMNDLVKYAETLYKE
jgi:hypothetical protein